MRLVVHTTAILFLFAGCPSSAPNADYCAGAPDNNCSELPAGSDGGALDAAAPTCMDAQDCTPDLPACSKGRCGPCGIGSDGGAGECALYTTRPVCGPKGACVECRTNDDCVSVMKSCGPDNTCIA